MFKLSLKFDQRLYREIVIRGWQENIRPVFEDIGDTMRALMRLPKSGKQYGSHTASAAGEAPAVLSKTLIGSIGKPQIDGTIARLVISDPKARYLDPQEGDPANTRVAPRPFVQPAIDGAVARANQGGILISIL